MSIQINTSWSDTRQRISALIAELQEIRDYEEEVSYDTEFADMLTTAIDANLALMPCVVVVQ